jgi:uncharacterized RDD family membrane protein YckC
MRCTKCHYLSFEPEARCRNCGHDLSIDELVVSDLPLSAPEVSSGVGSDNDVDLAHADIAGLGGGTATAVMAPPRTRTAAAAAVALAPTPAPVTAELPLFLREMPEPADGPDDDDDEHEPLIKVPARPRAPIAVRRTTPDPARLRAKYATPVVHERDLLDRALVDKDETDVAEAAVPVVPRVDIPLLTPIEAAAADVVPPRLPAAWRAPVTAGTRLAAAAIDAALLSVIAAIVTAFTLRFASVSLSNFGLQAALPLAAFVLLIAAGYLLMFTAANGQTLGKMALGIRVVGTSLEAAANGRVTIPQAALRAVTALPSALALGLGFVPALLGGGLAVHDRIAHTRVVRM